MSAHEPLQVGHEDGERERAQQREQPLLARAVEHESLADLHVAKVLRRVGEDLLAALGGIV